ncbi:TRAM domain-containing protein [Natronorubrum daqingense]|uniref:RNA-binding protein n=1 Tax=Natronorubrum daqingense TaxID=588898 RepID=A0A1N6ZV13_9EURY|nr:RNA-binding protein [Natronorubrum daqingense]APX95234.1 RNA-binding protein [Natronorubrum daqingense]SIR30698.1 Predicted RNA-binding protein, contains TRAM domain [Natronorubrum daqingense]
MFEVTSLAFGLLITVLFGSWLVNRVRGGSDSSDRQQSYERHRDAQQREAPVEIGDSHDVAVQEFTEHHTGERQAVCKVQGFVVFVENIPDGLSVGDVIEVTILSFNRGHTSATATFERRA